MKKSIVSALAIVFLLCLAPIVMAGGGPPSPNTATQPAGSIGTDGDDTGWEEPVTSTIIQPEENTLSLEAETIESAPEPLVMTALVRIKISILHIYFKYGIVVL